jgi:hypothetical protein
MTVTEFADMGQMAKFAQMGLEQSIAKWMRYLFRRTGVQTGTSWITDKW